MPSTEHEFLRKHHNHEVGENQCSSYLVKQIKAPVDLVWSFVRRFDQPQNYKPFVADCNFKGDIKIGSIREVKVGSGLPASTSTERLEILDDEERVFSVRIVGGDSRMKNYKSIVSVHPEMIDGRPGTLVVESFVVDVADGNTKDETYYFVEALIKCNLKSLADVSERLAVKDFNGGSDPVPTHESDSKSKAFEDMWKIMEQGTVPVEVKILPVYSNQEATSLTVECTAPEVNLTDGRCSELPENPNSKSKAIEVAEDKQKSIEQDSVPIEVESEAEYSNREASSLTVEWTAPEVNLTDSRCSELPENPNSKSKAIEVAEDKLKSIEQDSLPMEVESKAEYLNQEASSLAVEWTAPEINLTNGRYSELPEKPNCPFLVKLFLQHNTYLTEIPASFFENMPVLRVLDISHTSIKTLPSSISKLFRLWELFLRGCEMLMELPPEIGRLTNLKVLDLEGTELVRLPKQVAWLLQLERLKFSLYRYADRHLGSINGIERSIIPRETLSKLSSLKELSIDVDPECEWWDAEVEAIVKDLGKLGNLETLKLYFPTVELFQQLVQCRCVKRLERDVVMPLIYPTLSNFRIIVGHHGDNIMSCVPRDLQDEFLKLEKCLKYVNGKGDLDAIITKALKHVDALFLDRHWTIQMLSKSDIKKMDKLKFCMIAECNEMKTILGAPNVYRKEEQNNGEPILGSLHYLGIHYMKNLRRIWTGPIVNGSLSSLKILAIHTCPELCTIFNRRLLQNLIFLQELIVEDCPKVQSLVTPESSLLQNTEFLPRLKKISLLHLPKLKNVSSGLWIAPRLEKMVVYNCPKLKNLHPLERCSKAIKEIKGEIEWWESNKSDWSSDQHDYLVRVFVPLEEDDESIDEVAEAVQISLTMGQVILSFSY